MIHGASTGDITPTAEITPISKRGRDDYEKTALDRFMPKQRITPTNGVRLGDESPAVLMAQQKSVSHSLNMQRDPRLVLNGAYEVERAQANMAAHFAQKENWVDHGRNSTKTSGINPRPKPQASTDETNMGRFMAPNRGRAASGFGGMASNTPKGMNASSTVDLESRLLKKIGKCEASATMARHVAEEAKAESTVLKNRLKEVEGTLSDLNKGVTDA